MTAGDRKVAFVTGASSGIGRATAEAFAAKGYAVAMADREEAAGRAAAEAIGGPCRFIPCDVTDEAMVEAAVRTTVETFGGLHAAFNAAGINGDAAATADCTPENWDRVIAVDLTGVWRCMRHELRQMMQGGGGAIVNCASVAGLVGSEHLPAYVAAKHGVIGLTRTAALEYIRHGIRVNAVCPGMIDTPMFDSIPADAAAALVASSPVGRFGKPAEIAEAVVWLCDPASSFVVGHALTADGGWTAR